MRLVEPLGGETIVYAAVDVPPVVTDEVREVQRDVDEIALEARARESRFAVRLAGDEAPSPDERVQLALDGRRLHFFDPKSGEALARP